MIDSNLAYCIDCEQAEIECFNVSEQIQMSTHKAGASLNIFIAYSMRS